MGELVIIGASVRAAAMSALRAGWRPRCADLFADRDLQRIAATTRIRLADYPAALGHTLIPGVPWKYTGGLENYPELLDRWATVAPLLGNCGRPLRACRDPFHLTSIALAGGVGAPTVHDRRPTSPQSQHGRSPVLWLMKPRRGSGGQGIRHWDGAAIPQDMFLQEYVPGSAVSAQYRGHADGCRFLGLTRQLVGAAWLHAAEFQYCGSIGPLQVAPDETVLWRRLGDELWREGLRHEFGVDAIVPSSRAVPAVIEVNPRYTAALEVLEWEGAHRPHRVVGKAVYYAPRAFCFPTAGPWDDVLRRPFDPQRTPAFADIPDVGERFAPGDPVLTLFAEGENEAACAAALQRAVIPLESALLA